MSVKALPVPSGLTPGLVERLAALHGEPARVAAAGLSAMGEEDLQTLGSLRIIKPVDVTAGNPGEIEITEYGHGVIAGCAVQARRTGPRQVFGDL